MHDEQNATFAPSPKDFNLMVLGQVISILGSALLRFALSLYVLDTTGSETAFATIYAVSNIPLLLAPLGGAIADRFNRQRLMVLFDFTSSAIVLGLIILMAAGNTSIIMMGIVMVLLSVVSALYTPTVMASIPLLVASDKLESANGIVQAVQALSTVAAPIMGGILYGTIGVMALIIMSCVAFFLSAVMEIFIKIPFTKREQTGHIVPTIAGDLKDGFRYVVKVPFILKAMILAALLNLVLSPYFVVGAPIILRVTMQSSDNLYGIGMGLVNAATILGALTIGFFSKKIRVSSLYRWLLLIAVLCLPMALALAPVMLNLGYYPSYTLFMVAAVPIAMIMTMLSIYITASVQKTTPNENLGKVMAIIIAVAQCATPLGQIIYGFAFETFSQAVYVPTLMVALAMLIIAICAQRILRYEGELNA